MKPPPFAYADPETVGEVLDLLAEHGDDAALLAGGQSLVPLMNLRLARPDLVIDLRRLGGLTGYTVADDALEVGALTTAARLTGDDSVAGLTQALRCVGHPQIRARTTVGGSIAHADPAAELPTVLAALRGSILLRSSAGDRVVAAADFFDGAFTTTRRPGELVVGVRFPIPEGSSTWLEVARRRGDFALVGVFVARSTDGWRVACSGVGSTPVVAAIAEAALDADDAPGAFAALAEALDPPDDLHGSGSQRRSVAVMLLRRAVANLTLDAVA